MSRRHTADGRAASADGASRVPSLGGCSALLPTAPLFGARHGDAEPMVLALHGWRRTHKDWERVLGEFDAIAVDLPGFGATPAPLEALGVVRVRRSGTLRSWPRWASRVVVIGHSFGGSVAVELAATAGPQVAGLVLTGAPVIRRRAGGSKAPLGFRAARWLNRRGVYPDEKMEKLRLERGSEDYRAATGVMRDTFVTVVNQDVAHRLPGLQLPVALVWGSEDTAAPPSVAVEAHALLPDSTLRVLDGVSHDVPAEAPAELAEALSLLIQRQTRSS